MEKTGSIYHQILGVPNDASIEEIKKAYKRRAKELHPDYNPSPSAHEDFIKLNDAYLHLTKYNSKHWSEKEEEKRQAYAKEQARAYAQKRYEEFVNSQYYKEMLRLNEYGDIVFYLLAILIVNAISLCVIDRVTEDDLLHSPNAWIIPALLSSAIAMFSFPFTKFNNISQYENDMHIWEWGILGASVSLNFYAYLFVCCNTIIPLWLLSAGIFCTSAAIYCYFAYFHVPKSIRLFTHTILLGTLPTAIILILNNESGFSYEQRFLSQESFELQFQSNFITKTHVENEAEELSISPYNGSRVRFREGFLGYPIYEGFVGK